MMTWFYKGRTINEEDVEGYVGFVYIIADNHNNKKYIGKKLLTKAAYKTVKGKRKKVRKKSDWEEYYGSNKTLQEEVKRLGTECFTRTILYLCKTKAECSYYETWEIFRQEALLKQEFYNDWVSTRIRKDHLKHLSEKRNTSTYDIPEEKIDINGQI
jgi:hypothetical protein